MPDPWDVPANLPKIGDRSDRETYESVGYFLSAWEGVEHQLARLYSVFIGRPDDLSAIREYGEGEIFTRRAARLEAEAAKFFVRPKGQAAERQFDKLLCHARNFSARRNEVAHGTVSRLEFLTAFRSMGTPGLSREHWGLVPSEYTLKKFKEVDSPEPTFTYTSESLKLFAAHLWKLASEIEDYHDELQS